ncbi:MAG: metal-dependent hydrolase [Myxococcota bacterium]
MDNATHALLGLLAAEAAILFRGRRGRAVTAGFATSARWVSVLANNLPDLDSVYAKRLGGKLGYLLHHRGHTHTLVVALGLGLLLWAVWLGMRRRALSRVDRLWLLALALAGGVLHIAFDYCNNYGVHPFWPWFDDWVYGDCLFIIEPWLWVFAVPALYPSLSSRWGKGSLAALLLIGLGLSWALSLVPWGAALLLTIGAAAAVGVCWRLSAASRLRFALAGWVVVLLGYVISSRVGYMSAERELEPLRQRGERIEEVILTPAPINPLCFSLISVSVRGDEYHLRAARMSVLPSLISAKSCRIQPTGLTLGLSPPEFTSNRELHWEGDWQSSVSELRRLDREHCLVHALLGFARAPFWQVSAGDSWLLGDLRFDRDPELDFDELEVPRRVDNAQCLRFLTPWRPPRESLLRVP